MTQITQIDSKTLAAKVVIYRSLGIHKDLAVQCMEELGKRRAGGDNFDYELFIEEELKKIPDINTKPINIFSLLSQAK